MNMWASMYYRIEAHFQTLWMRCPKVIPALSYKRTTCTRSNIFSNINKPAQKKNTHSATPYGDTCWNFQVVCGKLYSKYCTLFLDQNIVHLTWTNVHESQKDIPLSVKSCTHRFFFLTEGIAYFLKKMHIKLFFYSHELCVFVCIWTFYSDGGLYYSTNIWRGPWKNLCMSYH